MSKLTKNKIKLSFSDKIFKGIATILTVMWIALLFFPIYWMVVSSFKDASVQYADPPQFNVSFPLEYTVYVDYDEEPSEETLHKDANLILWRMFGVTGAQIGKAKVIARVDGKAVQSAYISKADYVINRKQLWTKSILSQKDILSAIPRITEQDCITFDKEEVKLPKKQLSNEYTEKMSELFSNDEFITGSVKSCTYTKSPANFFDNYKIAWDYPRDLGLENGLIQPILNSLFIAVMEFFVLVSVSTLAAYSVSKLLPRSVKNKVMIIILMSGMVPGTVTLIPKYQVVQNLGLADSFWAIILPAAASFGAMLLFKGTFDAFPDSIIEAARLDGAGEMQIFLKFIIPSGAAIIGFQAITIFAGVWNDYFWPMMVLRDQSKYTVALVMNILLNGSGAAPDYSVTLALGFMISIPTLIIYAVFQKAFTYGFDYSGLKG
ncbi:MAG: carbohydrate ABC transporter permease [Oscillospiraceae bacterium]|nr:carbohydrate ABC transporter permease [Oscillospiraceae bacterium]